MIKNGIEVSAEGNRWKSIPISFELVPMIFFSGAWKDTDVIQGLPEDAKFISSYSDYQRKELFLVFESESFDIIGPREDIPYINVAIQKISPKKLYVVGKVSTDLHNSEWGDWDLVIADNENEAELLSSYDGAKEITFDRSRHLFHMGGFDLDF